MYIYFHRLPLASALKYGKPVGIILFYLTIKRDFAGLLIHTNKYLPRNKIINICQKLYPNLNEPQRNLLSPNSRTHATSSSNISPINC